MVIFMLVETLLALDPFKSLRFSKGGSKEPVSKRFL